MEHLPRTRAANKKTARTAAGGSRAMESHAKKRLTGICQPFYLVDLEGFEPLTSRMRTERSPN